MTSWRTDGVRVVPADALDVGTLQTPGMHRAAAVGARTGATCAASSPRTDLEPVVVHVELDPCGSGPVIR